MPLDGSPLQPVDITSESDALKYRGLAMPGLDKQNFFPSGRYRVKTRGAFNTRVDSHYADPQDIIDGWNGYEVFWK